MSLKFRDAVAAIFAVQLMLAAAPTPIKADTIYTYTGNDYTEIINNQTPPAGTYDLTMSVTGSFTLANPLAAGLAFANITALVLDYSFSNGRSTFDASTLSTSKQFQVETDAGGNIARWIITFGQPIPNLIGGQRALLETTFTGSIFDQDRGQLLECLSLFNGQCDIVGTDDALVRADPGTWSSRDSTVGVPGPIATPLPPALALFATGLACLGWLTRRRKKQAA